jgi:hypothetical protein
MLGKKVITRIVVLLVVGALGTMGEQGLARGSGQAQPRGLKVLISVDMEGLPAW